MGDLRMGRGVIALLVVAAAACDESPAGPEGTWAGEAWGCQVGFRLVDGDFEIRRACAPGVQIFAGRGRLVGEVMEAQILRSSCPGFRWWENVPLSREGEHLYLALRDGGPPWVLARARAMPGEGAVTGCYGTGMTFEPNNVVER